MNDLFDAPPQGDAASRTLLLVDGSSYLYRAFHAMPDLRADPQDRSSAPTGALRGMINMLAALEKEVKADYRAVVFDASGPTFRDAIFPEYKANRSPMPDDLRAQIAPIHAVTALLGWPVLTVPGIEADDVLGTLARLAYEQGLDTVISTGDKDMAQLVNERVLLIDTMNGKRRDVPGVQAEFGVPPALMLDFQTLVGDAVDNVPGVHKVGPKTAAKWLAEYGSLANLLAQADAIKGAAGEHLRAALPWLPTGAQLLKIKTDADAEIAPFLPDLPSLQGLRAQAPDVAQLKDFYTQYGFKGLVANLHKGSSPAPQERVLGSTPDLFAAGAVFADAALPEVDAAPANIQSTYETVLTQAQLDKWLVKIQAASLTALDTETTSLDPMQAQIVGLSLAVAEGEAAYIPLAHDYAGAPEQLSRAAVLAQLQPWLEDAGKAKVGANVKYDSHSFANHGIAVRGWQHDVMLQSYVLEVHRPHGLESLAKRHAGREGLSFADVCGKGAGQIGINQADIEKVTQYACEDVDFTLSVHQALWPRLQADSALEKIYQLEMDSSATLFAIERHGVAIDADCLRRQSHELGGKIVELEKSAWAQANGREFNLGSPKQLGEVLFGAPPDGLGLPAVKKTAKGATSTDEEVLEKLALDYPLPATILQWRSLSKLKSTYTDKLPLLIQPRTGRVHTNYAQAVAITGRLSSNDPNLQNIPVRTAEGRRIREAFVARPGCVIASCDYSQIELRIMAHLSGDEALIHAFATGQDVHRATAAEVFGVTPEAVSSEQRRYAKVINFGLIYGMSAYGLAKNLGISPADAKLWIERYFARYPGVRRYMEDTKAQAKAQGFVQTLFGRRLYLPEINSPNGPRRAGAERTAINAPMQGTAADLIKMAMNRIQAALLESGKDILMVMQVHDELVFDLPEGEVDWLRQNIVPLMEDAASFKVPLLAEMGVGKNWDQAH
jgi:DNA polymerase-1